jgi:hypothetical protein
MAASIARSARDRPDFVFEYRIRDFPAGWAQYARRFRERAGGFVYVSFNAWFSSQDYRQGLAERLGLPFSDRGLDTVSAIGGGSSFDGLSFKGRAQSMNVLERWKEMMDDDLFNFLLLAGAENLDLNAEIFGNFPTPRAEILERWRTGARR